MIKVNRRDILSIGAASAIAALPVMSARAAPTRLKIGHGFPLSHLFHTHLTAAAAEIEKKTSGEVKMEVLGAGQLGLDSSMITQTRQGALEFYMGSSAVFSSIAPLSAICMVGFALPAYADVWKAMDGELGTLMKTSVAQAGVTPLDTIWDNGYRQISTSTRPVEKVEDLKGLKLRVPVSPALTTLFKALGSGPVSLNFGEVYAALQTKLVDGQENPLSVFAAANFHEVQKYLSMTNHVWDCGMLVANNAVWKSLSANVKSVIADTFNAEAKKQRADSEALNKTLRASLSAKGLKFIDVDTAPFREQLRSAGFYKQWREQYGEAAWATLTRYSPGL